MAVGGGDWGCQEAATVSPPLEEPESCSCDPTHSEFAGRVEDGAPQGAHNGWVFVGSCRNPASRTGAWWRRHSLDLALGSRAGGLGSESMEPPCVGKGGSDLVELQGGGAAERPERSEES